MLSVARFNGEHNGTIGIGFVVLCYFFGKSEYLKACTQRELAAIALLSEAVPLSIKVARK